jgi:hypothetical protein
MKDFGHIVCVYYHDCKDKEYFLSASKKQKFFLPGKNFAGIGVRGMGWRERGWCVGFAWGVKCEGIGV